MLDAGACAAMTLGPPRVSISSMLELRSVLAALGFDRSASPVGEQERSDEGPTAASAVPARAVAPPSRPRPFRSRAERAGRDLRALAEILLAAVGAARERRRTMRPELPGRSWSGVRSSTSASRRGQVHENLESQRRQYELADRARDGFRDVVVIDEDLGESASGMSGRGFEALVGQICEGVVGAVLCLEASRLARNGRDWHHLLELCGLVGARVIDTDGIYDPGAPNDRLLLGLKGTMSEFELTLLRRRMLDAAVAKARRGELRLFVPIGYVWSRERPDRAGSRPSYTGGGAHCVSAFRSAGHRAPGLPPHAP